MGVCIQIVEIHNHVTTRIKTVELSDKEIALVRRQRPGLSLSEWVAAIIEIDLDAVAGDETMQDHAVGS